MHKPCILLLAFMSVAAVAGAQQQPPLKEGEIEAEQVIIVKERENELPPAQRSYQKIPPQQPKQEVRNIQFRTIEPLLPLQPIQPGVRVLRMQQDPSPQFFQRYVKAGIGNYISPLLAAHLSSPQQAAYLYHLQLRHESAARGPVDGGNSSWGETLLRAEGSYIGKSARISGGGWYERDRFNFYGYDEDRLDPDKSDLKQVYNRLGLRLGLENVEQKNLILNGNATVARVGTNRDVSENRVEAEGNFQYALSELLGFKIGTTLLTTTYEDVTARNRSLFRFLPGVTSKIGAVNIDGGFTFAWENDTVDNADKLHIYPRVEISVLPISSVKVFAGLRGDVLPVTYDFISRQNPFLNDQINLLHTQKNIELYLGATASIGSGFGAAAGFSVAKLENMHYFVNSPEDSARFDVVYDLGGTNYTNVYGQLTYTNAERWAARFRTDYYSYDPTDLAEPWHQPELKLEADLQYNLYDKIYLDAEAFVLSGIKARAIGTENEVNTLDPVVNLTLGGEYRFSPQATAFIRFHNLLNKEFERFQNYPSRKLLVRIGATYAF